MKLKLKLKIKLIFKPKRKNIIWNTYSTHKFETCLPTCERSNDQFNNLYDITLKFQIPKTNKCQQKQKPEYNKQKHKHQYNVLKLKSITNDETNNMCQTNQKIKKKSVQIEMWININI
jgi:hypothetical protein